MNNVNSSFVWGLVVGAAGVWVLHRYVRPMPSQKQ